MNVSINAATLDLARDPAAILLHALILVRGDVRVLAQALGDRAGAPAQERHAEKIMARAITLAFPACPECAITQAEAAEAPPMDFAAHVISCVRAGQDERDVEDAMARAYLAPDAPGAPERY